MLVVLANTGNWDADQLGVVGAVESRSGLPTFITNDLANLSAHDVAWVEGVSIDDFAFVYDNNGEDIEYTLNTFEYTCWSDLPAECYAIHDDGNNAPIMYVLIPVEV